LPRHPGRTGHAWRLARAQVLRRGCSCWVCGELIDFDALPRSPRSPSVDHVIPLSRMRGYDLVTQRRLALDPHFLRPAHYGCNSRRGARTLEESAPSEPEPSEDWYGEHQEGGGNW
jgi:5-methylcytosine-specific restriction endonuclease McrA